MPDLCTSFPERVFVFQDIGIECRDGFVPLARSNQPDSDTVVDLRTVRQVRVAGQRTPIGFERQFVGLFLPERIAFFDQFGRCLSCEGRQSDQGSDSDDGEQAGEAAQGVGSVCGASDQRHNRECLRIISESK